MRSLCLRGSVGTIREHNPVRCRRRTRAPRRLRRQSRLFLSLPPGDIPLPVVLCSRHFSRSAQNIHGSARLRVRRAGCLPALAFWPRPRFLRAPRPALARFALLACCVRSGAARPPPLRGPGPAPNALALRAPLARPSGLRPALSRPALVRAVALRGRCCPRFLVLAAPSFAGFRFASRFALAPAAAPRLPSSRGARFPLGPPPSGLRGRLAPPRGRRRPVAAFFPASAPGLFCSRARALRFSSLSGCCVSSAAFLSVGSPLRPSRPRRPRWGLRGSARLCQRACGPPLPTAAAPPGSSVRKAI